MENPHVSQAARAAVPLASAFGAAVIALGAIAWGGSTEHLHQAVVVGAFGALLALAPARRWPERGFWWPALGLLLLAASAWWPARWFHAAPWRLEAEAAGIALPATLSPQPELSSEAMVLLAAGLAWAGWLAAQPWDARSRRLAARTLAGGLIALAAVALMAWHFGLRVPGWLDERGFGPFPNRNHTGHVLALGAVLALGCAGDAARRNPWRALPWVAGAAVTLAALAVNYSRGGVLLFLGAAGMWAALAAWQRRSWKMIALGASALLALSALLLVAGGPFAARFAGGADSQIAFRRLIWQDTLALIHAGPWCGVGLGNFEALFPFYRTASVIQQRVLHPESDWLWLAAEVGWPGVALALAVLFACVRSAFPMETGTLRRLRGAALAAGIAAALHGLIDVPAHRLGSALAALLVLALARREAPATTASGVAAAVWRGLGVGLIAAAAWWWPASGDLKDAKALSQAGQFAKAEAAATRALRRAPLNWSAYFTRAGARACAGHTLEALADFRRARLLEPHYAGVPLEEGRFWASRTPALALPAWREALRRVSPPEDEAIFGAMMAAAPDDAAFRAELLAMAHDRPALQLEWFQAAPAAEGLAHFTEISAAGGAWDAGQRAAFQRHAIEIGAPVQGQ
jgi:tetratricopeptide (TPR) repeat protein